ncbi:hypothetical protein ACH47B_06585 [Rhodococcus sp. NPDC019627]|uniref:hypothetical protein n=1 Tax=unclassified Rhodococcus (in: high G+C Gram-positive bacteria) TaxID=192944 RepID=UPI0037A96BAC
MIAGGVLVRRFLSNRRLRGRTVIVQVRDGVAYRGKFVRRERDGLVLSDASVIDEKAREPRWAPMDGEVLVAGGDVQHVQVP